MGRANTKPTTTKKSMTTSQEAINEKYLCIIKYSPILLKNQILCYIIKKQSQKIDYKFSYNYF